MKRTALPVYSQVAYDIAVKIASGELPEGERFAGRSLMSSRYGVSSETVRRAVQLLEDMGIVATRTNVGSQVLSRHRALEYVEQYTAGKDLHGLRAELKSLIAQRDALNERITEMLEQITDLSERFQSSDKLRTYQFTLTEQSRVAGHTVGELSFRQKTGATIVAVNRGGTVSLSPGPQTTLLPGDELAIACDIGQVPQVREFLE